MWGGGGGGVPGVTIKAFEENNPEPFRFLASNFEKSIKLGNHTTVASIQISNADWTNEQYIER